MVMNYADIYESVEQKLEVQDWYDESWAAAGEEDSIRVYRRDWEGESGLEVFFESHGQGEDPEQNPILLTIEFGPGLDEVGDAMEDLEERIQEELKPLIGWGIVHGESTFARKELPSDPLTLQPRLLEEFKKLEPIAFRIDQLLGYAPDHDEALEQLENGASGNGTG